jgi:hypothetical protein
MPVGNQWKLKAKEDAAAKAAPAPDPAPASTGDQGKKIGGSRLRSKGGADGKQPEAPPAQDADGASDSADASQTIRPKSLVGKWAASQDDQKV